MNRATAMPMHNAAQAVVLQYAETNLASRDEEHPQQKHEDLRRYLEQEHKGLGEETTAALIAYVGQRYVPMEEFKVRRGLQCPCQNASQAVVLEYAETDPESGDEEEQRDSTQKKASLRPLAMPRNRHVAAQDAK